LVFPFKKFESSCSCTARVWKPVRMSAS